MFEGNEPAERKECLLCSSSFAPNMMLVILEVTQLLWLQLNWEGRINWWQFLMSFWSIANYTFVAGCWRQQSSAKMHMQQAQCHYQPAASPVSFSSFQCNQVYFLTLPKTSMVVNLHNSVCKVMLVLHFVSKAHKVMTTPHAWNVDKWSTSSNIIAFAIMNLHLWFVWVL
jgi:hypothetical protein